jgi:hypothetical protein
VPAGEALFVWVGGAAEPAQEGVRRAEAWTIHQLSNRVVDHCHVTAPLKHSADRLTLRLSRAWRRERSGRWKASAAAGWLGADWQCTGECFADTKCPQDGQRSDDRPAEKENRRHPVCQPISLLKAPRTPFDVCLIKIIFLK